ncbi:hypothetical protein HY478_01930 [Candidatus Uhrbacteria bacterium]|nr:hypothetical protein [Candidatus Uhrbacteria bacterium]
MTEVRFDPKDVADNRVYAALAYLWVLFLVPLFLRRGSPYAQSHARQGLVLFIVQAVSSVFVWVPIVGQIWNLLIFFVVPLYALVRALTGIYWQIPLISGYARRISFD